MAKRKYVMNNGKLTQAASGTLVTAGALAAKPKKPTVSKDQANELLANSLYHTTRYRKNEYVQPMNGYEIIMASNGVFRVEHYPAYRYVEKIGSQGFKFLDAYPDSEEGVYHSTPDIPIAGFLITYEFFNGVFKGLHNTRACSEAMIQIFYAPDGYDTNSMSNEDRDGVIAIDDNWFAFVPKQSITAASVNYERSTDLESKYTCVIDIHSHDSMGAFFSGVDDADEQEPRFYAVFGKFPWKAGAGIACRFQRKCDDKLIRENYNLFDIFEVPDIFNDIDNNYGFIFDTLLRELSDERAAFIIASALAKDDEQYVDKKIYDRTKFNITSTRRNRSAYDRKWVEGYGYGHGYDYGYYGGKTVKPKQTTFDDDNFDYWDNYWGRGISSTTSSKKEISRSFVESTVSEAVESTLDNMTINGIERMIDVFITLQLNYYDQSDDLEVDTLSYALDYGIKALETFTKHKDDITLIYCASKKLDPKDVDLGTVTWKEIFHALEDISTRHSGTLKDRADDILLSLYLIDDLMAASVDHDDDDTEVDVKGKTRVKVRA